MMIPIATDGPAFYRPVVTIGLIAANTAVFFLAGQPSEGMLSLGNGWQPWEWVTAAFLHADVMHLIGNMIFLWSFGMVVEGRVGWWRFLAIYLLIALLQHGAVEIIFGQVSQNQLHSRLRYVLGASGAINGLMVIALLWAPYSEFTVVSAYRWGWHMEAREDEISILSFSLWLIGWDLLVAFLNSFSLSTPVLHLTGASIGFLVGVAFLQWRWVDCEHVDVFTLWTGCRGRPWKQLQSLWKTTNRRSASLPRTRTRRASLPRIYYPQAQPSEVVQPQRKKQKNAE